MQKKGLSGFFLALLLAGLFAAPVRLFAAEEAKLFSDVPRSHAQYVPISYLVQAGVLRGYDDTTFRPAQTVNRAEALKIILSGLSVSVPSSVSESPFTDAAPSDWFSPYLVKAKALGVVQGGDGVAFFPSRTVSRAEFVKMLLKAAGIEPAAPAADAVLPADVPREAWFAPYLAYAGQLGIIAKDNRGRMEPQAALARAEVAQILYRLLLIRKGEDTQFLLHRAEAELAQIEVYIVANQVADAKRASLLAVDLTQQALNKNSKNAVVLGAAKLARAYDFLVEAFVLGIQKKNAEAIDMAQKAIAKATEAWEANNATQPVARHIKDRAREILAQLDAGQ